VWLRVAKTAEPGAAADEPAKPGSQLSWVVMPLESGAGGPYGSSL